METDELAFESDEQEPMGVSVLAKYDGVCRGFDLEGCDQEFLMFAMNQEENRKKWLAAERHQLQHQIDEATKTTSKLELQYHHLTMLLKDEVRTRTCLQEERRHLQNQIDAVRDFLFEEENLKDEVKEKLHILSNGRYPHLMPISNAARPIDKLDTISEVNTVTSLSNTDQSEEDLELSGVVRSYRNRTEMKTSGQLVVATTNVSISHGSAVATSTIENIPSYENVDERIVHKHCFKKQVIISAMENCCGCNSRIKFGRSALKCLECGIICHMDCESLISPCHLKPPNASTARNLDLASPQKPKGHFFTSPLM